MAAAETKVVDETPLPRGAARIPLWWMEITPHNILDIEEDERLREHQEKEARMYAELAAKDDYNVKKQETGDENAAAGAAATTIATTRDWKAKSSYQRGNNGSQWKSAMDVSKEGRQFKARSTPDGYQPGQYSGSGDGGSGGAGPNYSLSSSGASGPRYGSSGAPGDAGLASAAQYGDKDMSWNTPSWTKIKLRSTNTGSAIRKGEYKQKTFHNNGAVKKGDAESKKADDKEDKAEAATPAEASSTPADGAAVTAAATKTETTTTTPETPAEAPKKEESPEKTPEETKPSSGIGRFVKRIRRKKVKKRKNKKPEKDAPKPPEGDNNAPPVDAAADTTAAATTAAVAASGANDMSPKRLKPRAVTPPPQSQKDANDSEPAWVKMRREREERNRLAKEAEAGNVAAPAEANADVDAVADTGDMMASTSDVVVGDNNANEEEEEEYEEEYEEEEYYTDEEYEDDEEYVEEIIIEDEEGNEVMSDAHTGMDVSTHDVTDLQAALAKKANELKLLEEQLKTAPV
mmetsp:Transcript_23761/g.67169  ORF Transcript_23761/g.67169 Transcript_23761/m.67169 type:complete len:519 (-) Transcript_23761:190-1746(-)|eukprot:CAMPEP_0119568870 /NCGR_PEP_ID=MMETSP1352-20130426/40042_1 /TAXON_ID=265584 /ORGANISM="Stauroneis constricta, Strain CCMP1120" /LENGTH=518 /DNA_ID=CAMNT_0007618333 /DNA_START=122 /DNA_END=1678 /DNA_ORIENTATION=-